MSELGFWVKKEKPFAGVQLVYRVRVLGVEVPMSLCEGQGA